MTAVWTTKTDNRSERVPMEPEEKEQLHRRIAVAVESGMEGSKLRERFQHPAYECRVIAAAYRRKERERRDEERKAQADQAMETKQ